jgi:hypothetical protein
MRLKGCAGRLQGYSSLFGQLGERHAEMKGRSSGILWAEEDRVSDTMVMRRPGGQRRAGLIQVSGQKGAECHEYAVAFFW